MTQYVNAGAASRTMAGLRAHWLRLLIAAAFLPVIAGVLVQGPEYDESIMMLTVSGHTSPVWPDTPVTGGELRGMFEDRNDAATLLSDIRNTDVHPPLHYVAAWFVHLVAGPNLIAQRALSLAALAGCFFLLLGQWRRDADSDTHSTAVFALLFMLAPASYFAGSTARGYALVFLFLAAAWVALRRLTDERASLTANRRLALAAVIGLGTGLALLTHYLAAVAAFALGMAALVVLAMRRDWREVAVLCVTAALPVLISAWFLLGQLDARGGFERLDFPGVLPVLGHMAVMLFLRVPGEYMPLAEGAIAMMVTAVPTALALIGAAVVLRREPGRFMVLWLPLIIVVAHVAGLIVQAWATGADLYKPRYLVPVWPFAAIILARGVLWYARFRPVGLAVPTLLIAAYAGQVGIALTYQPGHPFKYNIQAVDAAPGSPILVVDRGYNRGIPGSIALAASPQTRLWFVTPEMLENAPPELLPGAQDELHFVVSDIAPSGERITRWLDALPARFPYVEQETNILRHRRFTRRPAGE